jgi:hypothetical protein
VGTRWLSWAETAFVSWEGRPAVGQHGCSGSIGVIALRMIPMAADG